MGKQWETESLLLQQLPLPGQRAENAAGEDREARGEICKGGALQQDPHGGVRVSRK